MNTLRAAFIEQIRAVITEARQHQALAGLVFISGKPDSFIAGADISMIDACRSADEARQLAEQGQRIMSEIAALPVTVVAAIHGPCLGGGTGWRWPATGASVHWMRKPCWGCRKCSWACCPAAAARSVCRV